jgi:hypothetical protein
MSCLESEATLALRLALVSGGSCQDIVNPRWSSLLLVICPASLSMPATMRRARTGMLHHEKEARHHQIRQSGISIHNHLLRESVLIAGRDTTY